MDIIRNMDRKLYSSLGAYPAFLWLFKDILDDLKVQLEFQDHLLDHVTSWKEQISSQLGSECLKLIFFYQTFADTSENLVFIGVHCRRTDFVEHYKHFAHGNLVDHNHFDNSFEVFFFDARDLF